MYMHSRQSCFSESPAAKEREEEHVDAHMLLLHPLIFLLPHMFTVLIVFPSPFSSFAHLFFHTHIYILSPGFFCYARHHHHLTHVPQPCTRPLPSSQPPQLQPHSPPPHHHSSHSRDSPCSCSSSPFSPQWTSSSSMYDFASQS